MRPLSLVRRASAFFGICQTSIPGRDLVSVFELTRRPISGFAPRSSLLEKLSLQSKIDYDALAHGFGVRLNGWRKSFLGALALASRLAATR